MDEKARTNQSSAPFQLRGFSVVSGRDGCSSRRADLCDTFCDIFDHRYLLIANLLYRVDAYYT